MIHQVDRNGLQSIRDLEGPADGASAANHSSGSNGCWRFFTGESMEENLYGRISASDSLPESPGLVGDLFTRLQNRSSRLESRR